MIKFRIELPIKLASEGNIDRLGGIFTSACDRLNVDADITFVEKSRLVLPQVYLACGDGEVRDALILREQLTEALS